MRKFHFLLAVLCIFLLLVAGCLPKTPGAIPDVMVPSLRAYLPTLDQEAWNWSQDAYLYRARLYFEEDADILISAEYGSSSHEYEIHLVEVDALGAITSTTFTQITPNNQREQILTTDWLIDSQDALDTLLTVKADDITTIQDLCGHLSLTRDVEMADFPVIWRFSYYPCKNPQNGGYARLNPISGEIIIP